MVKLGKNKFLEERLQELENQNSRDTYEGFDEVEESEDEGFDEVEEVEELEDEGFDEVEEIEESEENFGFEEVKEEKKRTKQEEILLSRQNEYVIEDNFEEDFEDDGKILDSLFEEEQESVNEEAEELYTEEDFEDITVKESDTEKNFEDTSVEELYTEEYFGNNTVEEPNIEEDFEDNNVEELETDENFENAVENREEIEEIKNVESENKNENIEEQKEIQDYREEIKIMEKQKENIQMVEAAVNNGSNGNKLETKYYQELAVKLSEYKNKDEVNNVLFDLEMLSASIDISYKKYNNSEEYSENYDSNIEYGKLKKIKVKLDDIVDEAVEKITNRNVQIKDRVDKLREYEIKNYDKTRLEESVNELVFYTNILVEGKSLLSKLGYLIEEMMDEMRTLSVLSKEEIKEAD